jgi:hypothetical protein
MDTLSMDTDTLITRAAAAYRLTMDDVEIVEWDGRVPINDTPAVEAIASLQDEAGQCWRHDPGDPKSVGGLVMLCRVVLLRLRSLDVVLYMQHRHPVTNLGLQTDRDVDDATSFLRTVSLPQLQANQPRLQQTLAGALKNKLARQLTEEVARARLEVESLISEISEREWAAGWHLEAEHRVWAMLLPGYAGEFTGLTGLEPDEEGALRSAAELLNAWPMDRGAWVPMEMWVKMHEDWASKLREGE